MNAAIHPPAGAGQAARRLHRLSRAVAALAAFALTAAPLPAADTPQLQVDDSPLPREKNPQLSYKGVVDRVAPSVVTIYSSKTVRTSPGMGGMFSDPFFRQFFGGPPGAAPLERQERSLGSGVIVSADGYILTNNHVIEGADRIRVALPSSPEEIEARVIGSDPQTDIAVVKIDRDNLPAATIGDSDQLAVGDVVLAIGNPFNVGQTVTVGIAGAIGRGGIGIEDYEDFIQTDASINPGNSGGPLVDGLGRVVGINTAILSRTGGNQGVGFAVPVNLARHVFEQITTHGKVTRGFLGVTVQPLTPELAQEFNLEPGTGALVADVTPGQAAANAGLQSGDVIVSFNGAPVKDARALKLQVAQQPPGTDVEVQVMRNGERRTLHLKLGEQPQSGLAAGGREENPAAGGNGLAAGLELQDLTPALRQQAGIPAEINGAIITGVAPDSAAATAGLQPGDVIRGINHQSAQSAADVENLLGQITGDNALLRVWSQGGTAFVILKRPENPQ